ncbi:GAF domain-containing sensor histidine kinase [Alteromonas australica]|jgi:signal transduction histidine kinase|uniref:histidine kinase n=1 Tax=Alteromonas australica TaxID=589873 RepID=A0A358E197_9ALTE|nr:HAMP domain-containing sensor histidine kinase [Alteromonas australica]MAF72075.1 sensor histidine kinase [Alteromonas sp.]MBU33047.1 sensor histidine kinase [Alteromonas sp.]HAI71313.1 sensor histidine kinase [Alteromonas australica]HBU52301.1 sensor histidine kinase [Alteromonas australica]|tara:strand:+ start:19000 stop:20178 length:1179 start_codon:yes stop_codon:yes gene_type:complete
MQQAIQQDIAAIQAIEAVPHIMNILSEATGLRFICVARVTEDNWTMCSVLDKVDFNLKPGDELEIQTTFCSQVRQSAKAIVIEEASKDSQYKTSPIPVMYGFESYFSYPIYKTDGSFFGTLCGLDPTPTALKTAKIDNQIASFAELISRQLEVNDQLSSAKSALFDEQSAAKLREQYIAILGHDIRTPLSSLKMGVDFLSETLSDGTTQKVLKRMDNSVNKMKRLINDVMDFTHGKMGKGISLNVRSSETLQEELLHGVNELATLHPECHINTNIQVSGPHYCDPERIGQLLSNLLINAIVHGDHAHPIDVYAGKVNGVFTLSVANSGTPIPEDTKAKLFQPFWRNKNAKHSGGLGLGLFIASQIAEAHQGKLSVVSNEQATVFTFSANLRR